MSRDKYKSKKRAKSALILGHTTSGMGERILAYKVEKLLKEAGISVEPIIDIIELMGDHYERLAKLNYDLADADHALLEGIEVLNCPQTDLLLILSWCFSVAALFATNIHFLVQQLLHFLLIMLMSAFYLNCMPLLIYYLQNRSLQMNGELSMELLPEKCSISPTFTTIFLF